MLLWSCNMTRLSILIMLLVPVIGQAQFQRPTPVNLHFTITVNDNTTKAQHLTLEFMDAVGSSGAFDRRDTGNDGIVVFNTYSGLHRFRISGPGIQTYEGEVELSQNERVHHERVIVRSIPDGTAVVSETAAAGSGPVPAIRLKIPPKAQKDFEKGTEAMNKQQWDASRKYYEAAIREYPDFDMAYNGLGVVQVENKEIERARRSFERALELNPDYAGASRNLARILISENRYSESLKLLKRSLETEPGNAWALTYAAYAELLEHNFEDALGDARKVHALPHEGLANAHVVAALSLEAKSLPQEALAEWKLYLAEDPNGPSAARARKAIAASGK
jgi:hypothetical protein